MRHDMASWSSTFVFLRALAVRAADARAAGASPLYLSEPREAGHDGVGFGRRFVRGQKSDPLHLPISSAEIG